MKRACGHFVPIAFCVCVLSVGLLLCGSAVAKGANVVEKATAGQVNLLLLQSEMAQAPVVLPDIAVAPSTAIISSIHKDLLTQKTSAKTSPTAHDFECAITKVCATAKYGLVVTHQPRTSVVRT